MRKQAVLLLYKQINKRIIQCNFFHIQCGSLRCYTSDSQAIFCTKPLLSTFNIEKAQVGTTKIHLTCHLLIGCDFPSSSGQKDSSWRMAVSDNEEQEGERSIQCQQCRICSDWSMTKPVLATFNCHERQNDEGCVWNPIKAISSITIW